MRSGVLYAKEYKINNLVSINIPTVKDIVENEDDYFETISLIVSTPYDMMVQLDDNNIDFTKINEWDLFCLLFSGLQNKDASLVFGDLDLKDLRTAINRLNGNIELINEKTGEVVIDRAIHDQICRFLRELLHITKNDKRPANEDARQFMLERARVKMKRNLKKRKNKSMLEEYIVALVNTSEFPYDYESVLELTIYQFYASLYQIVKKVEFDNLMIGCYAGTVDTKEIDPKRLSWINN